MYKLEEIRAQFPMLQNKTMQGKPLVFLDNASTTFKPQCVLDSMNDYYTNYTSNSHRGDYDLCIEFADAALAVDEEALDPRLLKISVYEERGDVDTVLDRCLAFIKRDPENETIYRKIISIYIER